MRAVILAFLLTLGTQAEAKVFDDRFRLSNVAGIKVILLDQASGACWTNLKKAREYAKEALRIKGVDVVEDLTPRAKTSTFLFQITVMAQRISENGAGPCYGFTDIKLSTATVINGSFFIALAGTTNSIAVDDENLNRHVIENVEKFINGLK